MRYQKTDSTYILTIDRGEKVIETVTAFCKSEGIQNAYFNGIGAISNLTCGYYALDEKKYYFTDYDSLLEVISLTGNVMLKDDEPFVHMHGVFTGTDNNAFGGHVKEMRVGVTLEVILTPLASSLDRQLNDDIGLFLINCPDNT